MSQLFQTAVRPDAGMPVYFSPASYFLGFARRIAAAQGNMRVALPGRGEVIIWPERREYCTNVPDMAEFCRTPASEFELGLLKKDEETRLTGLGPARPIGDLLWQAAFHASQGRLVASRSNGEAVRLSDIIRFRRWPNLTRLPKTPNTMRICALLTRHPSSILLVSRKLGIAPEEVYQVYSAACSSGIVNVLSNHLGQSDIEADIQDEEAPLRPMQEPGLIRSLLSKISGL